MLLEKRKRKNENYFSFVNWIFLFIFSFFHALFANNFELKRKKQEEKNKDFCIICLVQLFFSFSSFSFFLFFIFSNKSWKSLIFLLLLWQKIIIFSIFDSTWFFIPFIVRFSFLLFIFFCFSYVFYVLLLLFLEKEFQLRQLFYGFRACICCLDYAHYAWIFMRNYDLI